MSRRPSAIGEDISNYARLVLPSEAIAPILSPAVKDALKAWMEELFAESELKPFGLRPRRRAAFYGPPGTGKTTLAHHLSARLGLPMAIVQSDQLVDCWLGSSGRNVAALFKAAKDRDLVLFFDEFDSLGAKRTSGSQGADSERNATLNILLKEVEAFEGILIAATNREDELDPAIWRRFELQIEIALPGPGEVREILRRYIAPLELPEPALKGWADLLQFASPALIRQLCEAIKREAVLGPKLKRDMSLDRVLARVTAAVAPHPDLQQPLFWQARGREAAIASLPDNWIHGELAA